MPSYTEKVSNANHRTKIEVIESNRHKNSVSAMCNVFQIARRTFYHDTSKAPKKRQEKLDEEKKLKDRVLTIFNNIRKVYRTRKINRDLDTQNLIVSSRCIGWFMKELECAKSPYKPMFTPSNEEAVGKVLNREFKINEKM